MYPKLFIILIFIFQYAEIIIPVLNIITVPNNEIVLFFSVSDLL